MPLFSFHLFLALENLGRFPNVYAEWAPDEKGGVDVALCRDFGLPRTNFGLSPVTLGPVFASIIMDTRITI